MEEKDIENQEPTEENKKEESNEEEAVSKKAFDGIRSELIQTRQEKQILANQLQERDQKVREFENRLKELEVKKENQELNSLFGDDDEEPVTSAKLKQAWKALQSAQAQQKAAETDQAQRNNFQSSINKMRLETQDKVKYGLDWDTLFPVINRIYAVNKASNPAWEKYILGTSNPAQELYNLALKEPDIQERMTLVKNGKVLNSMENQKVDKSSVDGGTSPKPKELTPSQIMAMTDKERMERMDEINAWMAKNKK